MATWDEWLASLDEAQRTKALGLAELFEAGGADDPKGWARSEVKEDIAQAARFAFLRAVWRDLHKYRDPAVIKRVVPGLDDAELELATKVAGRVAYETAFSVISVIDDGLDTQDRDGFPGWVLMEIDRDDEPTGRPIYSLHESLLELDPLGIEAEDLLGS